MNNTATVRSAVEYLAGACDHAQAKDGAGFNKFDSRFGHNLVEVSTWTPGQTRAAWQMLRKYSGQLATVGIDYSAIPEPPVTPAPTVTASRTVSLSQDSKSFLVAFAYNAGLVDTVKATFTTGERRFDGAAKRWVVTARAGIVEKLYDFSEKWQFDVSRPAAEKMAELIGTAERLVEASRAAKASPDFSIDGLGGTLRPFQAAGVAYALEAKRCFIADEMGLGKTVEALATVHAAQAYPAVIVCPASLKLNWLKESLRWIPSLRESGAITILSGSPRTDVLDSLQCLIALNAEIRQHDFQQGENVRASVDMPSELSLLPHVADMVGRVSFVDESSERCQPFNQGFMGIVDAYAPGGMASAGGHDTSFPVNNTSEIGSISLGSRGNKGADGPLSSRRNEFQPTKQMPQSHLLDSELGGNVSVSASRTDSVESGADFISSHPAVPPFDAGGRSRGKSSRLQVIAQSGSAQAESSSSIPLRNLALLKKERDALQIKVGEIGHSSLRVVIINYDIIHAWLPMLQILGPQAVVFDESHFLKSHKSRRSEAAKELAQGVPIRLALTGTPVINRPQELLSQLGIIGRLDDIGGFWGFAKRFCNAHQTRWGWDFSGAQNLDELNTKLRASCYIRRNKADVLKELPAKTRTILPVALSNRREYDRAEKDLIGYLRKAAAEEVEFLASIADLSEEAQAAAKQARSNEAERKAMRAEQLVRIEALKQLSATGKIEAISEWMESFFETGEKLVLFTHHISVVERLAAQFNAPSITGATPLDKRQEYVDRFQNDPNCKLIILNIQAGGVGLTLTAASNVAFVELDWTPAAMDQATDRCHRIGQLNAVNAWYLVGANTIDEEILELIEQKRQIVDAATEGQVEAVAMSVFNELLHRLLSE